MNKRLLLIGGFVNLLFAMFHLGLGQLLNWKETLASLALDTRATVYTLNFSVATTCLAFAYLSLFHRQEILATKIGKAVLIVIGGFWVLRAIGQVVFYGFSAPDTPFWTILCLLIGLLYIIPIGSRQSAAPASMPL